MDADYRFTVKNEKAKNTYVLSILLCLISAVFFSVGAQTGFQGGWMKLLVACILGGLAWNTFVKAGFIKQREVPYNVLLALAAIGWFFIPGLFLLGLPFVLLAAIEKRAGDPLTISISAEGILFESLFKKSYPWTDLNNVILKDGMLTLDFNNNRLIQKNIDTEVDEQGFNRFCTAQIPVPGKPTVGD